jgi:hypothetical protein
MYNFPPLLPPQLHIPTTKNITPVYNFEVIPGILIISEAVLIKMFHRNESLSCIIISFTVTVSLTIQNVASEGNQAS